MSFDSFLRSMRHTTMTPCMPAHATPQTVDAHRAQIDKVVNQHNERIAPPEPVPQSEWPSADSVSACAGCRKAFGVMTWKHR